MKEFRTYQLSLALHRQCEGLAMKGILRDQLERASLSVVLNLAEGSGKLSGQERRRFFSIAMGSLREVQACLDMAGAKEAASAADAVGAHLHRLLQKPGYLIGG